MVCVLTIPTIYQLSFDVLLPADTKPVEPLLFTLSDVHEYGSWFCRGQRPSILRCFLDGCRYVVPVYYMLRIVGHLHASPDVLDIPNAFPLSYR